jgi:hypothetical protein
MPTYAITVRDELDKVEDVEAEYFQVEDRWLTFKDNAHKAVASFPEGIVLMVRRTKNTDLTVYVRSPTTDRLAQDIKRANQSLR